MDEPKVPASPDQFRRRLRRLHRKRKKRHHEYRDAPRKSLTPKERALILKGTRRQCHICGGRITRKWQADHVRPHASGGPHRIENYLPAHTLCNHYRWDYSPEEFQWILKLGVWTRSQIEHETALGDEIRDKFHTYELHRHGRRRHSS